MPSSRKPSSARSRIACSKMNLGYSDEVSVYLNGTPLFHGASAYRQRDPSFLGIVGLFDAVYLPLKKGENELTLLLTETMGGWGFVVQDATAVYEAPGVAEAWTAPDELPRSRDGRLRPGDRHALRLGLRRLEPERRGGKAVRLAALARREGPEPPRGPRASGTRSASPFRRLALGRGDRRRRRDRDRHREAPPPDRGAGSRRAQRPRRREGRDDLRLGPRRKCPVPRRLRQGRRVAEGGRHRPPERAPPPRRHG